MEEQYGESGPVTARLTSSPRYSGQEFIKEKILSFHDASICLNTLGKDESGVRYAYLMMTLTDLKLTDISIITNFKHLLMMDVSGNFLNLEALTAVEEIPFLLYLKAERNRIESAALKPMPYLQVLILNRNHITETCDINQPMLETLEMGANLIYTAQFDTERLKSLKQLSLHQNHLMDTSGSYPTGLEKLFLGSNKITKINTDFSTLPNLKVLHLRNNNIKKLNGFSGHLVNLTYLNLRGNKITKIRECRKLDCLPKLDTLLVLENPMAKTGDKIKSSSNVVTTSDDETSREEREHESGEEEEKEIIVNKATRMRLALLVLLPNLKRIDKDFVNDAEREEAYLQRRQFTEMLFGEESSEEETELPTTTDFTTDFTTGTETEIDNEFLERKGSVEGGEGSDGN